MNQPDSSNPYQHAEAFCLMQYASKDGSEREIVWNSRDGVTPAQEDASTLRKRGGPEFCPSPCEGCPDGVHHFGELFGFKVDPTANPEDPSTGPHHPAAQLGVEAWQNCKHCPAWREMPALPTEPGDADFEYDVADWI